MASTFGLSEHDMERIIEAIGKHNEVEHAIIFGSRAMGNYKRGSDVDIALLGKNVSYDTVRDISVQLNEHTTMPYRFDIINGETANDAILEHIATHGVQLCL